MKAWIFGGRAKPTQVRIHMSRGEADIIDSALYKLWRGTEEPDVKKTLDRLRDAMKKSLLSYLRIN